MCASYVGSKGTLVNIYSSIVWAQETELRSVGLGGIILLDRLCIFEIGLGIVKADWLNS